MTRSQFLSDLLEMSGRLQRIHNRLYRYRGSMEEFKDLLSKDFGWIDGSIAKLEEDVSRIEES
jgi:hypothetical protein